MKQISSLVFKNKIKISAIINFRHWLPLSILHKFKNQLIAVDKFIGRTPISYLTAHLLLVECKKQIEISKLKYAEP